MIANTYAKSVGIMSAYTKNTFAKRVCVERV